MAVIFKAEKLARRGQNTGQNKAGVETKDGNFATNKISVTHKVVKCPWYNNTKYALTQNERSLILRQPVEDSSREDNISYTKALLSILTDTNDRDAMNWTTITVDEDQSPKFR